MSFNVIITWRLTGAVRHQQYLATPRLISFITINECLFMSDHKLYKTSNQTYLQDIFDAFTNDYLLTVQLHLDVLIYHSIIRN